MRLNIQGWLKKQIETLFSTKANTSANNFTSVGKQNVVDLSTPNYQTGVAFSFVNDGTFTAPVDCYVKVICYGAGNSFGAKLYNTGIYLARITPSAGQFLSDGFVLSKGDWFTMEGSGVSQLLYFKLKGSS